MLWSLFLLPAACGLARTVESAALLPRHEDEAVASQREVRNANHIFNAIHSSMRQWGSSLNHNGMSLFMAQVPAGTEFYHGTHVADPIESMEWLAFEPEHAINFARMMGRRPPKGGPPPHAHSQGEEEYPHHHPHHHADEDEDEDRDRHDNRRRPPPPNGRMRSSAHREEKREHPDGQRRHQPPEDGEMRHRGDGHKPPRCHDSEEPRDQRGTVHSQDPETQEPMTLADDDEPRRDPGMAGWLHTYKAKDTLSLLYIDGTSAGKCDKGTLDTQDVLLLNYTGTPGGGMFGERERAQDMCKMANEAWGGKVKGFLRMEAGFEVILCSFVENLDFVGAVRAGDIGPGGEEPSQPFDNGLNWIKAITARYDGIGGDRVRVDYDNFVTGFTYDFDLFTGEEGLPRLKNLSVGSLDQIRHDVDTMVANWDSSKSLYRDHATTDWQAVADMVVERYARELKYLSSGLLDTQEDFLHELEVMLRVFIDSDARNTTAEVDRCVAQLVPKTTTTAGLAIASVTKTICSTLFAAFDSQVPLAESVENLQSLIAYLDWTTWKRCTECPLDKVCFIPIWPFGSPEDHDHPQCRNATELRGRHGYWGPMGPPGRGGPGGHEGRGPPKFHL